MGPRECSAQAPSSSSSSSPSASAPPAPEAVSWARVPLHGDTRIPNAPSRERPGQLSEGCDLYYLPCCLGGSLVLVGTGSGLGRLNATFEASGSQWMPASFEAEFQEQCNYTLTEAHSVFGETQKRPPLLPQEENRLSLLLGVHDG